jgi:hypothetical protein
MPSLSNSLSKMNCSLFMITFTMDPFFFSYSFDLFIGFNTYKCDCFFFFLYFLNFFLCFKIILLFFENNNFAFDYNVEFFSFVSLIKNNLVFSLDLVFDLFIERVH